MDFLASAALASVLAPTSASTSTPAPTSAPASASVSASTPAQVSTGKRKGDFTREYAGLNTQCLTKAHETHHTFMGEISELSYDQRVEAIQKRSRFMKMLKKCHGAAIDIAKEMCEKELIDLEFARRQQLLKNQERDLEAKIKQHADGQVERAPMSHAVEIWKLGIIAYTGKVEVYGNVVAHCIAGHRFATQHQLGTGRQTSGDTTEAVHCLGLLSHAVAEGQSPGADIIRHVEDQVRKIKMPYAAEKFWELSIMAYTGKVEVYRNVVAHCIAGHQLATRIHLSFSFIFFLI